MKAPAFDYHRPGTLAEVLALLRVGAGKAKLIAGGQSLMPMLNFRLLVPEALIDLREIAELRQVSPTPDGGLTIGAAVRHCEVASHPEIAARYPILIETMQHVAHLAVRNRGTLGGSLCHADPAAEMPLMMVLHDARLELISDEASRIVSAGDFFLGPLTTCLGEDEILVRVHLPHEPALGWAFAEFAPRRGDFALASVAVLITAQPGEAPRLRIGLGGIADTPLRAFEAEAMLAGFDPAIGPPPASHLAKAAEAGAEQVCDMGDTKASVGYRQHLLRALFTETTVRAWRRAAETLAAGRRR